MKGETCNEETLLYQAVSGLHASINMHIASNYFDSETNTTYMNHSMYLNTLGTHPDRLKNLHFLYALVVRAVSRIHDQLLFHDYSTGLCKQDHDKTLLYMSELLTGMIS